MRTAEQLPEGKAKGKPLGPVALKAGQAGLAVDLAPQNPHHLFLSNPVMIASGTLGYDGYGRGLSQDPPLERLGAVIPKTVTRLPREGNPEPRWHPQSFRQSLEDGKSIMLNSIGLANPGIRSGRPRCCPPSGKQWDATVLLSLSAGSAAEFGQMAAMAQGRTSN